MATSPRPVPKPRLGWKPGSLSPGQIAAAAAAAAAAPLQAPPSGPKPDGPATHSRRLRPGVMPPPVAVDPPEPEPEPDAIPNGVDIEFASEAVVAPAGHLQAGPRSGLSLEERRRMAGHMQSEGFLARLAGIDSEIWPELERLWLQAPF